MDDARQTAYVLGMPDLSIVELPRGLTNLTPAPRPVGLAAAAAIAQPQSCLRGTAMSTGPHSPLLVVNGPVAGRIGMNSGRGALGPSRESAVNIVIGRALRLVMVNCGYAYLGLFDLDTIGAPRKFSYCLAENEADSPFAPYHVD